MADSVPGFTPTALIDAIEANSVASLKSWAGWHQLELRQDPNVTWTSSEIPFFLFDMVLELSPGSWAAPERLGQVVTGITSQARSRQMPMGWWVGPNAQGPELGLRLEEQGWVLATTLTGMATDLFLLKQPASPAVDLKISLVNNAE